MNRGSSLMTIVIALALGAATFGAHRYLKRHPETLAFLGNRVEQTVDEEPVELPDSTKPPLEAMREAEAMLWEEYGQFLNQPATEEPGQSDRTRQLVVYISERRAAIDEMEGASQIEIREARLISLRAHFVGARTVPAEFAGGFVAISKRIINDQPGGSDAAQAEALLLLHQHASGTPDQGVVEDLHQYSRTYPNNPMGIQLYCTQSEELWKRGQNQLAERVLRQGLKVYAGHPQAGQLVNQLADQRHSVPREARLTQEVLRRHMRELGRKDPVTRSC